jgi:hypothetical protein
MFAPDLVFWLEKLQVLYGFVEDKHKIFIKDQAPVGAAEFTGYRTAEVAACAAADCKNFELVPETD